MSEGGAGEVMLPPCLENPKRNSIEIFPFLPCGKSLICLSPFNKITLVIIIK